MYGCAAVESSAVYVIKGTKLVLCEPSRRYLKRLSGTCVVGPISSGDGPMGILIE